MCPPAAGGVSDLTFDAAARQKIGAAQLSVASNALLVGIKLAVGLVIGSVSVLSEAIHSATDLAAALIAFFAVRASSAPPDADHPYGHGKYEAVSGFVESGIILAAGIYIIGDSVVALRTGHRAQELGWGLAVMALSTIVNALVSAHLVRVAHRADSAALEADGNHLRVDVWTSLGVFVGLLIEGLTHWVWVDPVIAILVACLVLYTGWRIGSAAMVLLLDTRLPDGEVDTIELALRSHTGVISWHKLRTRKAGSQRYVDVHIQVADDLSIKEAHDVTEDVEDAVRSSLPNVSVTIHTEPYEAEQTHQASSAAKL